VPKLVKALGRFKKCLQDIKEEAEERNDLWLSNMSWNIALQVSLLDFKTFQSY
jgi:hypothetical protein